MARLTVHVTPRSGRDEIVGWRGGELAVRVTVAPEGGKANSAVEKLLAQRLHVAKSSVHVVRGHVARIKQVEVSGLDDADLRNELGEPDQPLF